MSIRASTLPLALLCTLAMACGASAPAPPHRSAATVPEQGPPPRVVPAPIVVGDGRPEQERAMDARVGQANSATHGALREAALDCQSAPEAERHLCTREHRERSSRAAQQRADRRFAAVRAVGDAVEACESRADEAAREACAKTIEQPDTGPSDSDLQAAIDWRWARQIYSCQASPAPRSVPCASIAALTAQAERAPQPTGRFIGAGVVRTYMEHEHHELLAVELRMAGETTLLCAAAMEVETDAQRTAFERALGALFGGHAPASDAAPAHRVAGYAFASEQCKRVELDGGGRWQSTDGRWLLGGAAEGFAFRARDWGPQVAFVLAELRALQGGGGSVSTGGATPRTAQHRGR